MGGSSWSSDFYKERAEERAKTATPTFAYTSVMASKPASEHKTHPKLDPKGITREARDSAAHPASVPIGFILDVTGSMHRVPIAIQKELPRLMDYLLGGFVTDPQILFGAVGDATCDRAPLQIGQFESGVEMEDDLINFYLEGGGGGSNEESYELALYFFARHTSCDHMEKRGKKGYLFLTGDELPYPTVTPALAERVFGDKLQAPVPIEEIVGDLKRAWNVYFILPSGSSGYTQPAVRERWAQLLGDDRVLMLENPAAIVETVATALALGEGKTFQYALDTMKVAGTKTAAMNAVSHAFHRGAPASQVTRF